MKNIPIIITGHGALPIALQNSSQMLVGKRDRLYTLCLHEGVGLENFIRITSDLISKIKDAENMMVFVDLQGGTPWNAIVGLNDSRISLIAGVNLPMLIEVLILRDQTSNVNELVNCAIDAAKKSVVFKTFPI